jgi:hypothetical protein
VESRGLAVELPLDVLADSQLGATVPIRDSTTRSGSWIGTAVVLMDVGANGLAFLTSKDQIVDVARALRRWVLRQPPKDLPLHLALRTKDLEVVIDLHSNPPTSEIVDFLTTAFDRFGSRPTEGDAPPA